MPQPFSRWEEGWRCVQVCAEDDKGLKLVAGLSRAQGENDCSAAAVSLSDAPFLGWCCHLLNKTPLKACVDEKEARNDSVEYSDGSATIINTVRVYMLQAIVTLTI